MRRGIELFSESVGEVMLLPVYSEYRSTVFESHEGLVTVAGVLDP